MSLIQQMDKMPEEMTRKEKIWMIKQYISKGSFKAAQKFYLNNSLGISLRTYYKIIEDSK